MVKVRTEDLLNQFQLELVAGKDGIHREILMSEISRPGIEMTGYFKYYPKERLQLLGKTELSYYTDLSHAERKDRAEQICTDITPGIVVSRGLDGRINRSL